jgi:hypothetical protein
MHDAYGGGLLPANIVQAQLEMILDEYVWFVS